MMTLVSGGAASGKSEFAERLLDAFPEKYYIATMQRADAESERRIARHRKMRAGKGFCTIECPVGLAGAAKALPKGSAVLLECLSNLAANELFSGTPGGSEAAYLRILAGIEAVRERADTVVIVTNGLFSDGVTYDPGTMEYLRLLARLNREIVRRAGRAAEVAAAIAVWRKGEAL